LASLLAALVRREAVSAVYEPPMMTYDEWLWNLGAPSSPVAAEAYRLYVGRFKEDNPEL
jgi:hypothetical protein